LRRWSKNKTPRGRNVAVVTLILTQIRELGWLA
jgi:hypothetical protein